MSQSDARHDRIGHDTKDMWPNTISIVFTTYLGVYLDGQGLVEGGREELVRVDVGEPLTVRPAQ